MYRYVTGTLHEHVHQGQTLRHYHPHGEQPHGYFDHPEDPHPDGDTFDLARDGDRLRKQHERVWAVMRDGQWRTLPALATATRCPEASVSARLRDFRKAKFGGHTVERRYLHDGLWEYRLLVNEEAG